MRPGREELSGWTTSASISETLWSFIRANPKDPVYNFRAFAFPALIRANWIASSWIWVLSCVGVAIYFPYDAIQQSQAELKQRGSLIESEKSKFCNDITAKSVSLLLRIDAGSFLHGTALDQSKLVALKQELQADAEAQDVLFCDKNVQSITGTSSYDLGESLGKNIWRIKIGKEDRTFTKFMADDPAQNRWVAVIWKQNAPNWETSDPTTRYLAFAALKDIFIFICLIPVLLLIRLQCEAAILFFLFVDEFVALHRTLKTQLGKGAFIEQGKSEPE